MQSLPTYLSTARRRFEKLADWLYGCPHPGTTQRISQMHGTGADGARHVTDGRHVICIRCGRPFAYDWAAVGQPRSIPLLLVPTESRAVTGSSETPITGMDTSLIPTPKWNRASRGLTALAVPMFFLAGLAGFAELQGPPPFQISVNVDLVEMHATVTDKKDQVVSGLRKEDFAIYEDGVRQSIRHFSHEDVPVTVGLIIDHSGSMRGKLPHVVTAARTFVQLSRPEDEMFVVNFNETVTMGLPKAIRFTSRQDELALAIANAPVAGQTALYDAIIEGLGRLRDGRSEKRVLIVVSDGADNASSRSLTQALRLAGNANAVVYTIGVFDEADPDRNPGVLRRLARETGGAAFFPVQLSEVVSICETIAREIRHQYALGYVSMSDRPIAKFRRIHVVVEKPGEGKLNVRTRSGYIPEGALKPVKDEGAK